MSCPKFDRTNKKHVIIAASVAAAIVLLIVIIVVVAVLVPGKDSSGSSDGGNGTSSSSSGSGSGNGNGKTMEAGGEGVGNEGLRSHNEYRKKHHADPLTLSSDLNSKAKKCAEYYAGKGRIDHTCADRGDAGENLYISFGPGKSDDDEVKAAVKMWYDEVNLHDFNSDYITVTGHFTQVVWKGSNELGMGIARKGSTIVVVGLYSPAGNMRGSYRANVLPA